MKNPEEEDVNLHDIVRVVFKRKMIVLSIFVLILSCTIFAVYLSPKIYEVHATIQRGSINGPVMSYPETEAIIKSMTFLQPIFEKLNVSSLQELQENSVKKNIIVEEIKDTNFFVLKVRLKDNDLGYLLIQEIIKTYLEYGNSIYCVHSNLMKNQITQFENLIEKTKATLEKSQKSGADQKNIFSNMVIPDDRVQMKDLLLQKFLLENQLLLAKEFKLIDNPVKPDKPIPSKKVLIIISSCMIALMIGLFCAFFVEDWDRTGERL